MKAKNNRRKKRGIKALFCFLLAAELTLGSLSTPAQAEASEITEPEPEKGAENPEITTPEPEKGTETPEITTPEAGAEETAEPTDPTLPPEKTDEESDANEQKQETTEPEETNPPATENTCICSSRCDIDNVNAECPVCTEGPDKCTYEEEPPADEPPVDDPPLDELPECTCTILCTESSINAECPICKEDPSLCAWTAPQEETPQMQLLSDLEEEPNPLADEPSAEQCICTALCTEDSINAECPVCKEDVSLCMSFQDETEGSLGLWCKVVGDGEVEITHHPSHYASDFLSGQTLKIPKEVKKGDKTYTVVGIGKAAFADSSTLDNPSHFSGVEFPLNDDGTTIRYIDTLAFWNCTSLTSLKIPKGVTKIGKEAFRNCTYLQSVNISDSVTQIEYGAFWDCIQLRTVTLPKQISTIEDYTFDSCGLRSIDIPNSVTKIGERAFYNTSLRHITIPSSVRVIGKYAFASCYRMGGLYITVKSGSTVTPITATETSFTDCLNTAMPERNLYFLTEDGTPLSASTNPPFEDAKAEYDKAGDGTDGDGLWWDWTIREASPPPEPATYAVTIKVNLDGKDWNGHGKTFALSKDGGNTYIDLTAAADGTYSIKVANGTYQIYEITETAERAVSYLDTGETVTVNGGNADAEVNYYTATFYDGLIPYDDTDTTDYPPQIVLKGKCVIEPLKTPNKSGYSFDGWKTEDGKDFNFAEGLAAPTSIYASWTPEPPVPATYAVTIQARLNGSLWNEFPWDESPWNEGEHPKKTFALSKDDGNTYITDLAAVADGTYKIYEITETTARAVSYLNTGVTVEVNGKNPDVVYIDYYTATFYDGMIPYGSATDQHPQIVLKNTGVVQPLPPNKSGSIFFEWKTEPNGTTPFDFANTTLNERNTPMRIYASWTAEEKPTYIITATAGEGGSISPEGDVEVTEGTDCTFTIQANTGYQIKAVIVDGTDQGALDRYTFTNVNNDGHAIEAVFKKIETGGGDEPGPDNLGGGGSSPDDSGDDHSGGGSDAGGSGGGNSSGGSSGGSSETGSSGGGSIESTNLSAGSPLPEASAPAKAADTVSNTNVNAPRPGEPKTGDASHLEVYASIAMIAGFVYLILYLMDGMKGMSEEEKNRRIAALLGWAKRGRARTLRRYLAIAAVFFVLAYYHAFGKRAALEWQKA